MIGSAVYHQLANDGAVYGLVGKRIYPNYVRMGDKEFPQIVYEAKDYNPPNDYQGECTLVSQTVTVIAAAETYKACDQLAAAVLSALNEHKGTWDVYTVQGCFLDESSVQEETVTEPTTERILYYLKELTFLIWYETF